MTGIIDIKLEQHSPLIHYQGNQPGAFLSAHALKAAIDHKMGNQKVGNSKRIVYSLDIRPQGQINKVEYTDLVGRNNKLYFGDMGGRSPSITVYTRGDVILRVGEYRFEADSPTEPGFYEAGFRESLKYTLAFSNFGKRGSKGFGCFWLAGEEPLKDYLKRELPTGWGLYKIPVNNQSSYTQLMRRCFEIIDIYYKILKSGINYPDRNNPQRSLLYAKAALMRFLAAQTPPETWDKRHIKDRFISGGAPTGAKMFRFRLGLAQNHEYRHKRFTVNFQTLRNGNVSDIARIPSPITFKIYCRNDINADILFYVNPFITDSEYQDLRALTIRATRNPPDTGSPLDMVLADESDLDLNALLEFTYRNLINGNLITGIQKAQRLNNTGAKKVSDTLGDIKSNLIKVR